MLSLSAAEVEELITKTARIVKKKPSGVSEFLNIRTSFIHLLRTTIVTYAWVQEPNAVKVEETKRESADLSEAHHDRCFSAVSPGEGKEILRQPCQWNVFGLSTHCKTGEFRKHILSNYLAFVTAGCTYME